MNIDIVQSPNPKRIKQFLNADGTLSEGGYEENLARGNTGWGNQNANPATERTESETEEAK